MRGTLRFALAVAIVTATGACSAGPVGQRSVATAAPATAPATTVPPTTAPTTSAQVQVAVPKTGRRIMRDGNYMCYLREPLSGGASPHGTGPTTSDFDGDGVDDDASHTGLRLDPPLSFDGPSPPARFDGLNPDPDPYECESGTAVRYASGRYVDYLLFSRFGSSGKSMATGDFDGDGYDDLAIGDDEERPSVTRFAERPQYFDWVRAGAVWVIPGGPNGLRPDAAVHLNQDSPGVPGHLESGERFGQTLAAGDLNGDGRDDLAIGTPRENIDGTYWAGAVAVLFGSPSGITTTGAVDLNQTLGAIPGDAEYRRRFGAALAIGNVNGDPYADLVVSAPSENSYKSAVAPGMIILVCGGPGGLRLSGVTSVSASDLGRPANAAVKALGGKLAIDDHDGDGLGDVIASGPLGGSFLFPERPTGLSADGVRRLTPDTLSPPERGGEE
jgi:hypothetical protein